ncbi:MAG: L-arabinose isomerase [Oscillospiraceae bacterium]|nr:L-arabinose isomerase [Oscillospiraceae bacterium]
MNKYKFEFIVGSQELYGDKILSKVNINALSIVSYFNENNLVPCEIKFNSCVTSAAEITAVIERANNDPCCAGVITWMHTFSPSKMWVAGLSRLKKPYLHINTQFRREIPWDGIDMEYMNLNQSAHGDREHGFIAARMRLPRRVIAGFWQDGDFLRELGDWQRSAAGALESGNLRVLRISDNMRDVAVTDGDRVGAQIKLGWEIEYCPMGDLLSVINDVTEPQIHDKLEEYGKYYDLNTNDTEAVWEQAKMEIGIQTLLETGDFDAFHTNFQDLHGLRQLPGLACQNLMRLGYGFAGEGDWKTAALTALIKKMSFGLEGGASFMEDYTYHFEKGNEMILGAHMLEICPSIAAKKPRIEAHPLSIGGKEPPARLVFDGKAGKAIVVSLVDMGGRLRMIANDIKCVEPQFDMPKLPVPRVLWKPAPSLKTSAECWILAGGSHHSVLAYGLTARHMRDLAEIWGVEFIHIGAASTYDLIKRKLELNDRIF